MTGVNSVFVVVQNGDLLVCLQFMFYFSDLPTVLNIQHMCPML